MASNRPDFSQFISVIEAVRSCISGVKRPDGSTINSFSVEQTALTALDSVLRALDAEALSYVGDFPQVEKVETRTTYPNAFDKLTNIA